MKRIRQNTRKNKGLLGRLINRIRGGKNNNMRPVDPAQYGGVLDTAEVIAKAKEPLKAAVNPLGSGISRIIKRRVAENVTPMSYGKPIKRIVNALNPFYKAEEDDSFYSRQLQGHEADVRVASEIDAAGGREEYLKEQPYESKVNRAERHRERQQLFNAMLGQPMDSYKGIDIGDGGLRPSQYKPTNAKDPDANYLSSPLEEYEILKAIENGKYRNVKDIPTNEAIERKKQEYLAAGESEEDAQALANDSRGYGPVAGKMTMSLGEDENGTYISYYDVWDLDPFQGKNEFMDKLADKAQNLLGVRPQELYGRVYYTSDDDGNITSIYDPKTGKTLKTFN